MTIINVSGQTQLLSALTTAKAGDILSLAGGNYGSVSLPRVDNGGALTLRSASDSNPAVFTKLVATKVTNLTIDNITFDGIGGASAGTGLQVNNSSGVKVINSDFSDLKIGAYFSDLVGLTVSNNKFDRMYNDAMDFADINGGVISKNVYHESGSESGNSHKDFIQFWTNAANGQVASKNIQITGNSFYSQDGQTHGIFINNETMASKHQNISITNNYIQSSQTHGITVSYADTLEIRNNILVKDGSGTPTINVTPDSTNVKILNNTAPSVADQGNATWTVAYNKETASSNTYQWTNGLTGTKIQNVGPYTGALLADGTPVDPSPGNGFADEFRFKGVDVTSSKTDTLWGLDFAEGDQLVLIGYQAGTFGGHGGGNSLAVDLAGTYVRIDSMTDLQELATYSPRVHATVSGDTLTLDIAQAAGVQTLVIDGVGQEYQSSFDAALF